MQTRRKQLGSRLRPEGVCRRRREEEKGKTAREEFECLGPACTVLPLIHPDPCCWLHASLSFPSHTHADALEVWGVQSPGSKCRPPRGPRCLMMCPQHELYLPVYIRTLSLQICSFQLGPFHVKMLPPPLPLISVRSERPPPPPMSVWWFLVSGGNGIYL